MQQVKNSNYPSTIFGRLWMKIPLVLRSILTGFGVSTIGIGIWVLLVSNLPIHWSVISMGVFLILFWMYFSGKWSPSNTQTFRRFCIRQTKLKKPVWIWGGVAAIFLFIFLNACLVFTFRIVEFQPEVFKTASYLNDFPAWMSWSLILMASLVAGLCEEVGYRGYLQTPLEQKYGHLAAISITSLVFVVIHLHQAWAGGILVQIFAISFMLGYLAYASNSLILGIIAHASFDVVMFSYWWSDVIGTFEGKPISMTGVDIHFIITIIVVLLSTLFFIVAIRRLLKLKTVNLERV
ncbi:MAG: type II CAAX endopeptidase family protein [Crocinitomicaceae bacterium]|nr:type II CAAX endopeptidase family protein [Crocinitomicaceae bacterium]